MVNDYYLVLEQDVSLYIAKETSEAKISINSATSMWSLTQSMILYS